LAFSSHPTNELRKSVSEILVSEIEDVVLDSCPHENVECIIERGSIFGRKVALLT
jgi:hypothetical protein